MFSIADFKGSKEISPINGSQALFYPPKERNFKKMGSSIAIGLCICVVIGILAAIYVIQFLKLLPGSAAQAIASGINAAVISGTNMLYTFVAHELTKNENYRTETEHEDSLIVKLFFFQFINSYTSFFFLAFIARWIPDGCGEGEANCMDALGMNVTVIFGSRLVIGVLTNVGVPYISMNVPFVTKLLKGKENNIFSQHELGHSLMHVEQEYLLDRYELMEGLVTLYANVALDFGYMTLFVTALPISGVLCLLSNMATVKGNVLDVLSSVYHLLDISYVL